MLRYSYIFMDRLSSLHAPADVHRLLGTLRDCGYDGVEFNLTRPIGLDPAFLERAVNQHQLAVPSFLTGEAYFDGLCLSSPRAEVRRQTVDRLVSYLPIAQRFGAILVVGLLQGTRRDEPNPEAAAERIVNSLREFAEAAEKAEVDIVIEPVNHLQVGFHNTAAEVRELIEKIGSPAVRPMVDTVHMNIEEASLTQPIYDCGAALRHVHLCESNGGQFGTGHVDFAAVLQALDTIGYSGFASVKVYRHLPLPQAARTSIDYLRNKARPLVTATP